jgi:hypothetical protein
MKLLKAIIYALYLIVYAYSAWMTTVEPTKTYWGFLCVAIFGFLFTWTVSMVVKNHKPPENNQENL